MRPRLSFANVVSVLALFVALGGASYAALKLPKNSVGNRQLKKNSVTGIKVKNASLSAADIAGGLPQPTAAGAAGGDLSGSYPSPVIRAGAVSADKLNIPAGFISAGLPDVTGGCVGEEGWADFHPSVNQSVGYYRSPEGFVYLEGSASRCEGSNATIFNLPPGYRPERRRYFPVPELEPPFIRRVEVLESDAVTKDFRQAGDVVSFIEPETQISLDGIVFRCGPSGADGCP